MILNILCNYYASYAYHINICFLINKADRKAVGIFCLLKGTYSGANFLQLFNICYHMVVRSSEVSLSIYDEIRMENFQENNVSYNVAPQSIDRSKKLLIRSYVPTLRDNYLYMNSTISWHTNVSLELLTTSSSSLSSPKRFSRQVSPRLITRSPICLEKSMNVSMDFFGNTEKVSKVAVKPWGNHEKVMWLHVKKFNIMLLICYLTLPLRWFGLCFWHILFCFYNILSYASIIMIWLMLLAYILILLLYVILCFHYNDLDYAYGIYYYASLKIIHFINITTMLLRWKFLSQITHLVISSEIPILMNLAIIFNHTPRRKCI